MFMIVFWSIISLLFFYTGFKFTHLIPEQRVIAWALVVILFGMMLGSQLVYRYRSQEFEKTGYQVLAWAGSLCMGVWASFILISIPTDLIFFLIFRKAPGFYQWFSFGVLGLSVVLAVLGYLEVRAGPHVKGVTVPVEGLPAELEGLSIVQISDLHVGSTIRRPYVEKVVKKVLELKPDVITITGDMIDGLPDALAAHVQPLAELKAPLGVFYVTGNHEYYWGAESWIEKAKALGFIPLINSNRVVSFHGAKVLIGGITDLSGYQFIESHRSDFQQAIQTSEKVSFKILLSHRPEAYSKAEEVGFNLQLSGHTHAGQFFPWSYLVKAVHRHSQGLQRHGRMWVYVNSGTGYWGPAHRFGIPSEITVIKVSGKVLRAEGK